MSNSECSKKLKLLFPIFFFCFIVCTVKLGDKDFLVIQKWTLTPNVPYPFEVNWHLVTGNGSLTQICSLSKRSLSPSLTVHTYYLLLRTVT